MNIRTEEFLDKFRGYENNDIENIFGDAFSEFINELNEVDLSENTLKHLNDIFLKDMKIFFRNNKQLKETEINKLNNTIDRMAKDIRQINKDIVDEGYYVEPFWLDEEAIKEYFMKEDK